MLAAARKCRYCGYRFDGQRRERSPLLDVVLGRGAEPRAGATLEEFLADWDIALEAGEELAFFVLAESTRRLGYLVATSERLWFVAQEGRKGHATLFEERLRTLSGVRAGGRRGDRLELSGPEGERVVRIMQRAQGRALAQWLEARLGGERASEA